VESGQNGKGIGFAGLQSLVSDIHIPPLPAATANSAAHAKSASVQPGASGGSATVVPDRDRGRWGLWIIGVIVVGAILIGAFNSNNSGTGTSNTTAAPAPQAQPYVPPAQSEIVESAPPAGDALPLSANEIAYCLASDARLTALKAMINDTSHKEIEGFNALISDFNSRCAQYHYRESDMSRAQSYISAHGTDFSADATAWLTKLRRGRRSARGGSPASANGYPAHTDSDAQPEPAGTDDTGVQPPGNQR
jgi:hypothetical protein